MYEIRIELVQVDTPGSMNTRGKPLVAFRSGAHKENALEKMKGTLASISNQIDTMDSELFGVE